MKIAVFVPRPAIAAQTLFLALFLTACNSKDNQQRAADVGTSDPIISQLTQEIGKNPNDASLYFNRAQRYYQNEGYDEAIQDLGKALSIDTINPGYLHLLADVYLDYFRSREALKTMEKAASLHPTRIPTLLKLSEFQLILKQYEPSLATIDRILQVDPQNAEAFFMMGLNFKESGDTARAINAFQQSVEYDPDLIDSWINLGQLQAALGNPIAERYFDSAIRINTASIPALHAKAFYLQSQGKLLPAIRLFQEITRIEPQYADAHYNAGLLYLDLDSIPQAYRAFDLAIQTDPVHIRSYFYRGLCSEMQGRYEKARADYHQALSFSPDYADPAAALRRIQEKK
jgi:tetratricopeptide (TPR) repeat protein